MKIKSLISPEQKLADDERRKNRNKYLGIGLLFIMAVSSIGYAFISNDSESNGNSVQKEGLYEENGQWVFRQGSVSLAFSTSPDEARNISSNINITLNDFAQKKVYVSDEGQSLFGILSQSVGNFVPLSSACYGPCTEDLPEKNCSEKDYLIVWNRTAENSLKQKENCIFIDGDIRAVDAFVYRAFGLV